MLELARAGARTVVTRALAHSPLRLLATRPMDGAGAGAGGGAMGGAARVFVTSYGGGLLGGDALRLRVTVGRGARAVLGTQASTKVYGSPRASRQELDARVGEDALLVLAPDPLVPYAGSRFAQRQTIDLAPGGSLALVDWVSGGRWARGERWALDRYESRVELRADGVTRLAETMLLEPESGGLPARLGGFETLATVVLAGPAVAAAARRVLDETAASPARAEAGVLLGASPLGDGAIVRLAARSTERARRELRRLLALVAPALGDHPWARRW